MIKNCSKKMYQVKKYTNIFFFLVVALVAFTSCSESDDETSEYDNWQARNDAYFEDIYQQAKENADNKWFLIKGYAKDQSIEGSHTDYIVVHVLDQKETHDELTTPAYAESPMYTDSVRVHYRGNLMPSESYENGYQFDSSWQGPYDVASIVPSDFVVSGTVDGFATALMYMHVGDRWMVYIPYNLGYGSSSSSSVPSYSTLRFDITLQAFGKPGTALPSFQ